MQRRKRNLFNGRGRAASLPGSAGSYITTPDSVPLSITGDIDIRAQITMADYSPASETAIVGKLQSTNQRSFALTVSDVGFLRLYNSTDGTIGTQLVGVSTLALTNVVSDGQTVWVRATLDVNDGAGNRVYQFFTSPDGVNWTQLGTTITTAGTTSIFDSTSIVEIGSLLAGTTFPFSGSIQRVQIRNGIGGTLVGNFDPRASGRGKTTVVASTGETWTLQGSAALI